MTPGRPGSEFSTRLRQAVATDAYKLSQIERTPDAPCWIAEVETWVIRDAWFWYRDPANSTAELLIGEHEGELAAVCGYMRTDPLNWYLPGLLVEHTYRSTKLGRQMLTLTLEHLSATSLKEKVAWLVHSRNDAMLELSSKIGAVQDGSTPFRCGTEAEPSLYFKWRFHL